MTNYNLYKDHYKNWVAETKIMLTDTIQLTIRTTKNSHGKLQSNASCAHKEGAFLRHALFEDFSVYVSTSCPKRITEKAVKEQHEGLAFETIIKEAKAFYKC